MLKKLFFISLSLCLLGCNSSDDSDNDDQSGSSNYVYFMSGKIDGTPFNYGQIENQTTLSYQLTYSNTLPAVCAYYPETGGFNYDVSVYPNFDNDNLPNMGINFVRFHLCTDDETQLETFNDKFTTGSYAFASSDSSSSGPTGEISLSYSVNSVEGPYYTTTGVDQSNSSFKITSSTPRNSYILETLINASQVVEGTFSATFKNTENDADIIVITDGQFKMIPGL